MGGPAPALGVQSVVGPKDVIIDGYRFPSNSQFLLLGRHASTIDEDQDEQDGSIVSKDDSKRRVPKGPNNAPVDTFCPRRWLVIDEEETQEEERTKPKTTVIRPSIKSGFRSFGSSARVCPGRDLA